MLQEENIKAILVDSEHMEVDHLKQKYEVFEKKYPTLFSMMISEKSKFDIRKLNKMITLQQQVAEAKLSAESASRQIGQELFDEYVQPNLEVDEMQN